jgi:Fic family protein
MDANEIARLEVQNGFRQYDRSIEMLHYYLDEQRPFALRPALIQELQGVAVQGLQPKPGEFRNNTVGIAQSDHQPPAPHLVPNLVVEMCDYVNDNLHDRTPFHIAAYIMWRHNWIHPFTDGNGRTSRTLSYLVLSIVLGYELPGSPTIPEQIQSDRSSYFDALVAADKAWENGEIDVSMMETLLKNLLGKQPLSVIETASGEQLV